MNTAPHTHDVQVKPTGWGGWTLTYGDTTVGLANCFEGYENWSSERQEHRFEERLRRAVTRHDQGSINAGRKEEERRRRAVREAALQRMAYRASQGEALKPDEDRYAWGSDRLKEL